MGRAMKRRAQAPEVVHRLFGDAWEVWETGEPSPRKLDGDAPPDAQSILAMPARQVIACPLWIEGTDPAIVLDAAKLELDVRGLVPRALGLAAVVFRTFPAEDRTLVVAAIFPAEAPPEFPAATRFDASPFLMKLAPDAVTLWREGDDVVAAVCRGNHVVYWETNDLTADAAELRAWLDLIVLRLRGEGIVSAPLRFANCVAGIPTDRLLPSGCEAVEAAGCEPSIADAKFDWRPESVIRADRDRARAAQQRRILTAVAAGYLAVAACIGIYFGVLKIRASLLESEASKLRAQIEAYQPIAGEWTSLLGRTAEPEIFPLEILSRVVSAMPPEGIRLTLFKIDNLDVHLEGEADSFGVANNYAVKVVESDPVVSWTRQTPTTRGSTTHFVIQGRIREP